MQWYVIYRCVWEELTALLYLFTTCSFCLRGCRVALECQAAHPCNSKACVAPLELSSAASAACHAATVLSFFVLELAASCASVSAMSLHHNVKGLFAGHTAMTKAPTTLFSEKLLQVSQCHRHVTCVCL